MVRLVFRPYTQIWRVICTSTALRASIKISPDFTLFRHSSPSFGSYQICSYSNPSCRVGRCWTLRCTPFTFIPRMSFSTRTLAYRVDSLIRVSRRDSKNHFGKITIVPQANRTLIGYAFFDVINFILPDVLIKGIELLTLIPFITSISFYRFLLNDFRSFHSLFKVLFIFPSQYLFAIGLPSIFSFGRFISPA